MTVTAATSWFATHETTTAIMLINCGTNIGTGLSNYLTPIYVTNEADMYKLAYMFLVSGCFAVVTVLTCISRSRPKMPPSAGAVLSASTRVSLRDGLIVVSNPTLEIELFSTPSPLQTRSLAYN